MDDSTTMRDRVRPSASILEMLERMPEAEQRQPPPASSPAEDDGLPKDIDPFPKPGDPYKAAGRNANKPLFTLFFLRRGKLPVGLPYSHLEYVGFVDAAKPGESPKLLLRFGGSTVLDVWISGRNLVGQANFIGLHVTPWLHALPGDDYKPKDATVITDIEIKPAAGFPGA